MKNEVKVTWRYHRDGEQISNFKNKAFRDPAYLDWIRSLKCFTCRTNGGFHGDLAIGKYDRVTASHIFRSYHGLKNHDWASVPMCSSCHWLYEYHKDKYINKFGPEPTGEDANKLYIKYLNETNKQDKRTPEQLLPI